MLLEFKIRSCEESSPAASSQLGGCVMTGLLLVAAIVNAKKPLLMFTIKHTSKVWIKFEKQQNTTWKNEYSMLSEFKRCS